MNEKYLVIFEVSQKQAYIFSSNRLRDNIDRSNEIAYVTDIEYIGSTLIGVLDFSAERNLVYTGGGHIILEFSSEEYAKAAISSVTEAVQKDFPEMELFASYIKYEAGSPAGNINRLTEKLENKKSIRAAAFHQGSFGIEKISSETKSPILLSVCNINRANALRAPEKERKAPDGFVRTSELGMLGASENESSFIAVVHIDGNAMGKRLIEITNTPEAANWDAYKTIMQNFSGGIAKDFSDTYYELEQYVADAVSAGKLEDLDLKQHDNTYRLPMRRIITEGDDICFVTEGRIGIECAVEFLKRLSTKKNAADNVYYSACAGVALVHSKYPFYKAYELAEQLCSNAKKLGAGLTSDGTGSGVSSIDWHIEFGELKDTLDETRMLYDTADGKRLELRPYIVSAPEDILKKEPIRIYSAFRNLMTKAIDKGDEFYSRKSLKELRPRFKRGEESVEQYLKFHKIKNLSILSYFDVFKEIDQAAFDEARRSGGFKGKLFVKTADGVERALIYDSIEIMDTYLPLGGDQK